MFSFKMGRGWRVMTADLQVGPLPCCLRAAWLVILCEESPFCIVAEGKRTGGIAANLPAFNCLDMGGFG